MILPLLKQKIYIYIVEAVSVVIIIIYAYFFTLIIFSSLPHVGTLQSTWNDVLKSSTQFNWILEACFSVHYIVRLTDGLNKENA